MRRLNFSDLWIQMYAALAVLIVSAFAGGVITIWYIGQIHDLFELTIDVAMERFAQAGELEQSLIHQKGLVTYFSLDGDRRWLKELEEHTTKFQTCLAEIRKNSDDDAAVIGLVSNIAREYDRYLGLRKDLIALYEAGLRTEGLQAHPTVRVAFSALLGYCTAYREYYKTRVETARGESLERARRVVILVVVTFSLILIAGVVMVFLLSGRILGPLRKLAEVTATEGLTIPTADLIDTLSTRVHGLIKNMGDTRSELEKSRERLWQSEKMVVMGKLASEVAHTIRNPMTSIKMRLFSLQRRLELTSEQEEDFVVISEELRRLDNTVTNFLEFSRHPKLSVRKVNLAAIVDKSLQLLSHRFEQNSVTVDRSPSCAIPEIEADPELMKEVFVNILVNACEAMKDGGRLMISEETIDMGKNRRAIAVRISDTGPGIPEGLKLQIMEPFFSTKDDGTGLGLPIAGRIVAEHGGRLEFRSASGEGATFSVILPIEGNRA